MSSISLLNSLFPSSQTELDLGFSIEQLLDIDDVLTMLSNPKQFQKYSL